MKLSNQAIGAIMIALQKGVLDQVDITGVLREFDLYETESDELDVKNPPSFKVTTDTDDA